jgi:hypothetical protein
MTTGAPFPFWWVAPAVVAGSAAVSLFAALFAIFTNRKIARAKATLDFIEATETKDFYVALYKHFRRFRTDPAFRHATLNPRSEEDFDNRNQCYEYLNHYEVAAIGFKEGILDEKFYQRWMEWVVLRDFEAAAPIIAAARGVDERGQPGDPRAYCDFERLCRKWGAASVATIIARVPGKASTPLPPDLS